jgi:hypothetical protein
LINVVERFAESFRRLIVLRPFGRASPANPAHCEVGVGIHRGGENKGQKCTTGYLFKELQSWAIQASNLALPLSKASTSIRSMLIKPYLTKVTATESSHRSMSEYYSSRLLSTCFGLWLQFTISSKALHIENIQNADRFWRLVATSQAIKNWIVQTYCSQAKRESERSDECVAKRFRKLVQWKKGIIGFREAVMRCAGNIIRNGGVTSAVSGDAFATYGVGTDGVRSTHGFFGLSSAAGTGLSVADGTGDAIIDSVGTATADNSGGDGGGIRDTGTGSADSHADVYRSAASMKLWWLRRLHQYRLGLCIELKQNAS